MLAEHRVAEVARAVASLANELLLIDVMERRRIERLGAVIGDGGQQHHDLASEIDTKRQDRDMTWTQVADDMGVPVAAIKGLTKLCYGPPIGLAMIAARWLHRSAESFMTEIPPSAFYRWLNRQSSARYAPICAPQERRLADS
jgi:hypothetical protein